MTSDSVLYLLEFYWPYALTVLVIGVITGWLSFRPAPDVPPASGGKS